MATVVVKSRCMRTGSGLLGLGKKRALFWLGNKRGDFIAEFVHGSFPSKNKLGEIHIDLGEPTFEFHLCVFFKPRVATFVNDGSIKAKGSKVWAS